MGVARPFLVSFLMIGVALYVRLRVTESPVFRRMEESHEVVRLPIAEALRRYPRNFLIGIGAHISDTALAYLFATFTVAYVTEELGVSQEHRARGDRHLQRRRDSAPARLRGALGPHRAAADQHLQRSLLGGVRVPVLLADRHGETALIWLALVVATAVGWAPMIAVQGAFYAELFGARVRYTGFAASRELGAAIAGFSPLVSGVLVGAMGGAPWLVAAFMILLALISFVAFYFSAETKDLDIAEVDPVYGEDQAGAAGTAR